MTPKKEGLILTNFKLIPLFDKIPQGVFLEWFSKAAAKIRYQIEKTTSKKRKEEIRAETLEAMSRFGVSPKKISARELRLFKSNQNGEIQAKTYPKIKEQPRGLKIKERMKLEADLVRKALEQAYVDISEAPDYLVYVSTHGYHAPSPALKFLADRGWNQAVYRQSLHMGCTGAFPGVSIACGELAKSRFLDGPNPARTDVVQIENFSTHISPFPQDDKILRPDEIISATLFGDGAIRYSVVSEDKFTQDKGFKILTMHNALPTEILGKISCEFSGHQFDLRLSPELLKVLRDNVLSFVETLCHKAGLDSAEIKNELTYAIHGGGSKIIDIIQEACDIDDSLLEPSRRLFYESGNMSSVMCPTLWHKILENRSVPNGQKVLTLAPGPGGIDGMILQKIITN